MCRGCFHTQLTNMSQGLRVKSYGGTALTRQRSTEPEIFTFDNLPEVKRTPAANPRLRGKRRAVKVLYPAQVRKYLPAEKKDWAKRMLLLFLSVVIIQVYAATEVNEEVTAAGAPASAKANLSRDWALEVSASSEELLIPSNDHVPLLPNLPTRGPNGISPAVVNPPETVQCYRMRSGPTACRM